MTVKTVRLQAVFHPKLLTTLRSYSRELFLADLTSGVIVGIVALPLAIAFAISSGVTPDKGLTTAIIAGFLISALGGSRVQIGGPTGAFVVIVYSIIERHGLAGLTVCTIMAGVILIVMGLCRLGTVIKFIPYPLTVGFTSGIALIIFSQQMRDLLGLSTGTLPADFLNKWEVYLQHLHTADPLTMTLSGIALAILVIWPRINSRVPGSIVALVVLTAAVRLLDLPVETIGSRFGELPSGLPRPAWPSLSFSQLRGLVGPAFTVAMLGAIESLLSATVADGMIESRHRSNTELIGLGVANIVTPLFGGIPSTGAIARTATNVRNGGRTPVAGMIHALTLLLIVLSASPWARLIPLCALAAILVMVSLHMSEWHSFRALLRAPRMDVAVLLTTFFLTVFVDLTVAVEVGMVMSTVLFMKRMTDVTTIREVTREMSEPASEADIRDRPDSLRRYEIPPGVSIYDAEGALFFGVAETLRNNLDFETSPPRVMILRMRHVVAIDASGLRALADLRKACARMGTRLMISGMRAQPRAAIENSGFLKEFGAENVFKSFSEALRAAQPAES